MVALQLKNICKKFSAKEAFAVNNVSFELNQGEILALVGESGCGKTTLLRMIAGLEIPDSGEISIHNMEVVNKKVFVQPEKRAIGLVFQDYALFPHLNVKENVGFGLDKITNAEKQARIKKYLELVGMAAYENRYPYELSGGQQQRLALARSLATEPSVLLLDEPFSNLDEVLKRQMRNEVRDIITQAHTTAVFVTHDTQDALAVADKIAVIKNGNLLQIGEPEKIYNEPLSAYVAKMFGTITFIKGKTSGNKIDTELGTIPYDGASKDQEEVMLAVRPEHFTIVENGKGSINGVIKNISFAGNHKKVTLLVNEKHSVIISVSPENNFREGDVISVNISKVSLLNEH